MGLDNVRYKEPQNKIIQTIVISGLIGILLGMGIMELIHNKNVDTSIVTLPDTSYNKVKLDSIKLQIGKHDTTIYKLNIKLKDDVEKSYLLNDSATVELFRKLATSTSAN